MTSTSEYLVGPIIGRGSFAHVVYAIHKSSRREVAIKVVDQVSIQRHHPWLLQAVMREKKLLEQVSQTQHNHKIKGNGGSMLTACASTDWIVSLWAAFYDSHHIYLVMELSTGGDFEGLLQQARKLGCLTDTKVDCLLIKEKCNETRQKWLTYSVPYYASQLIEAINFLHHQQQILHYDLKPQNLLVDARTGHLKLTDFTSSIEIGQKEDVQCTMVPRGTCEYSSPELLRAQSSKICSFAEDIWSVGCILYAVCHNGKSPFTRDSEALTVEAIGEYCISRKALPSSHEDWIECNERNTQNHQNISWRDFEQAAHNFLNVLPDERMRAWEIFTSEGASLIQCCLQSSKELLKRNQIVLPDPQWAEALGGMNMRDGGKIGWVAFQEI